MMQVSILEDEDEVKADDWCRPLRHDGTKNDKCTFSGTPKNNMLWVRFDAVFGPYWFGKTVGEINKRGEGVPDSYLIIAYEFVRGVPPKGHTMNAVTITESLRRTQEDVKEETT